METTTQSGADGRAVRRTRCRGAATASDTRPSLGKTKRVGGRPTSLNRDFFAFFSPYGGDGKVGRNAEKLPAVARDRVVCGALVGKDLSIRDSSGRVDVCSRVPEK